MDSVVKKNIGIMAYICDLVTMLSFNFIVSFKLMLLFFCSKPSNIHSHTPKQRKVKFKPRIKLNHNIYALWRDASL